MGQVKAIPRDGTGRRGRSDATGNDQRCCWKRAISTSSNAKARRRPKLVLRRIAGQLALVMTDVSLAGTMDGVALAHVARRYNPKLDVIVTSGSPLPRPLPEGVEFWSKPWAPLDVIRARRAARRGAAG